MTTSRLAERRATRRRVVAEKEQLDREIEALASTAQDAAKVSKAKSVEAVINPSPSANVAAAEAQRAFTGAFEKETEARDRRTLLESALATLDGDIAALERKDAAAARAAARANLRARIREHEPHLRELVAEVVLDAEWNGGLEVSDIGLLISDRMTASIHEAKARLAAALLQGE
jgi:hypothetical protein